MGFSVGNAFAGPRSQICFGVDPGLNRTGYAVIRRNKAGPQLLEGGVIRSAPHRTLAQRVGEIGDGIRELLQEFHPDTIAVEQVFSMARNPKTALLMAHARGAILYAAAAENIDVVHYTPRQIKRLLTGSGNAPKEQVQRAVQQELRLDAPLNPNDVADACAIALCHHYSLPLDSLSAVS